MNVINVNDMDELIGKVEIIDIREPYECQRGMLKTAKNIPMGELFGDVSKYLNKETQYYIICQSGARSANACRHLEQHGYNVVNVSGGMGSYVGTQRV